MRHAPTTPYCWGRSFCLQWERGQRRPFKPSNSDFFGGTDDPALDEQGGTGCPAVPMFPRYRVGQVDKRQLRPSDEAGSHGRRKRFVHEALPLGIGASCNPSDLPII